MSKSFLILCLLIITVSISLEAGGKQDESSEPREGKRILLEGKISVKGNEPHTYLVINVEYTDYILRGNIAGRIREEYQGRIVLIEGIIIKEEAGPGFPAEVEVVSLPE